MSIKEYLIELLKEYDIPKELVSRYAEILQARAMKFYVEQNLDQSVVDEDLYNGEDFDCSCSQEDADKDMHNPKCQFITDPYPNLDYSETEMKEWIEKEKKFLN